MLPRSSPPKRLGRYREETRLVPTADEFNTKGAILRLPGPEDMDQLLAIERQCFRSHRFTRENFEYHLRNPSSIFAVADSSNEVVGYAAGIVYHGSRHRVAKLYSMAVLPKARNRGLGSLLLRYFRLEAIKRKCNSVTLEVRKTNRSAQSLYRSFGYEVEAALPNYYGPGNDGFRMRRPLKPNLLPSAISASRAKTTSRGRENG